MSATITLPVSLRTRLSAIRRRARLLRAVRGLGLLILLLGLSGAMALLADFQLDLPALARQILFSVWLGAGVVVLLFGVVAPLGRRLDAPALAAVIEQRYPDLGERLTSAVQLAESASEGHGSPVLIALLMDETERQSDGLDFRPAVPARRAGVLAALSAVVVLLAAAPAFVWPQPYADLTQRFFRPWRAEGVSPLLVDSEELTPPARVTPVELAADSPSITVTPPRYARAVQDEETFQGLVDLSPLQHSQVHFDFRFTRPAVAAYLEWVPASGGRQPPVAMREQGADAPRSPEVVRHPLTLSEDRRAASFIMPAIEEGKYRLILEAEQGVRTVLQGGTIGVRLDQPPAVLKFAGKEDARDVLPYDRVPLEIETSDDIAVIGVELEYRVNDGEVVRQPLSLQGGDTPSARARHVLELAGKVKEDDRVSYRFRVRDNLPEEYKGPHVTVYPPDRWLTLQVARRGDPLEQRQILAQRDEINRKLEAIKAALVEEKRGVAKVRQETRYEESLQPEQSERVARLQQDNRGTQKAIGDLAQTAEATPALQPIADAAREVADREMNASQKALEQAPKQPSPRERAHQLDLADEQLASAFKRLDDVKKANDKLAQERLDRAKLEMLADREKQLAEQAAELAAKHPILDPAAKPQAEKIEREQAQVAAELERLAQQSEPLKQALEQTRAEQTRQLAERAREMARTQRDLSKAQTETERQRQAERLADLARKQQALAEQEAKLARETQQPARTAHTSPLKAEESQSAADALKRGDAREAVKHQDQTARDLERLAQAFDQAVERRRQKAQQEVAGLRRQQEDIARQVEQTKKDDPNAARRLEEAARRQAEVAKALNKMDAADQEARRERTAEALHRALTDLQDRRREDMAASQQEARRQIERLEQALRGQKPADEQAIALAKQQRDLAQEAARAAADPKTTPRQRQELQRKQQQVAEQTRGLQAPEAPERHRSAIEATQQAAQAAQARPAAVETRQRMEEAARKLDELAQQMAGEESDAAKAKRLARRQAEAAAESERQASKASTPEAQRRQQEIAREAQQIRGGDEARAEKQRATEALVRAQQAPVKEQAKARRQAADALRDLADRLAGRTAKNSGDSPIRTTSAKPILLPQTARAAPSQGTPSKKQSGQAKQLARQQRELRDAVHRAGQARGETPSAQQRNQQRNLHQRAGELARDLERMAQQTRNSPSAQSALQRATGASKQAQNLMQQAQNQAQQGQSSPRRQSQEQAAQLLDRASRDAAQAIGQTAQASAKSGSRPGNPKTGEAVAQARQQMSRAQEQMNRGQLGQAQSAMRQAAQSLAQAAKQMSANQQRPGQPGLPGQPIGLGRLPGGLPDLNAYGLDKTPYAGKSWGELPGELRTKIVQDMKARYGEDYARTIKYYFEQIASTYRPAKRPLPPSSVSPAK